MNYTKLPKSLLAVLAAPVLLALVIPATRAFAQSQEETKIRLMADALSARSNGDLVTAKANLEKLKELSPDDVTVQRLLDSVNAALAASPATTSAPVVQEPAPEPAVKVTFPGAETSKAMASTSAPAAADKATVLAQEETARLEQLIADARALVASAKTQAAEKQYDAAFATLDKASQSLPRNTLTKDVLAEIEQAKGDVLVQKCDHLLAIGDTEGARATLDAYAKSTMANEAVVDAKKERIEEVELAPPLQPIDQANPDFLPNKKEIAELISRGRSRYVAGDVDGAQETFREVETKAPDNPEAKYFLRRIAEDKAQIGKLNREKTRAQMVEEVAKQWQRPGIYQERTGDDVPGGGGESTKRLKEKLDTIVISKLEFSNDAPLSQVLSTISGLSEELDTSTSGPKGVDIVLMDTENKNPPVNITIREKSLKRVLELVTEYVRYQFEVQDDVVIVRPTGEKGFLEEGYFPITRSTFLRMTGMGGSATTTPAADDPFAAQPAPGAAGAGNAPTGGENEALKQFLQSAGVDFTQGGTLVYDGSAILVSQTPRNLTRIRNILNRYNEVKQVEIEAKFMEVQENAIDELGVQWTLSKESTDLLGNTTQSTSFIPPTRSLSTAFTAGTSGGGRVTIDGQSVAGGAPASPPGSVDLGQGVDDLASYFSLGTIGGGISSFDVSASLRAIAQKQGSDLLSAPKVTVLSGVPASISVGQELRYPTSFTQTQSDVGNATSSALGGTTGGGITITAGTPSGFDTRNVGVSLTVTPTVEEDDYSITLDLRPQVTEFEGFVEYGGSSVAVLNDGRTVTVPSGNYQPIFSTRDIQTKVTVWDGATIVMGGLTREDVRRVDDKVPVLGDIPFIGRLFRTKGEASAKRNLLIFVTANLVSPGGSPKKQSLQSVPANSIYQNPTLVTPASSESRIREK